MKSPKKHNWLLLSALLLIIVFCIGLSHAIGTNKIVKKRVVIATLVSHPALDQIIENIKQELTNKGYVENKHIQYIMKNASGDMQLVATIANDIKTLNPDLVVALTTPVSLAIAKAWKGPFVFSAVTDPIGAGIMPDWNSGNGATTGVSDMWPYKEQIELMAEIIPSAKTVGVLFNPGDAASQYGIKHIREILKEMDYKFLEGPCYSPNDVANVAKTLIDKVDALYLSSDATVISGAPGAAKVCINARKPLIVGDNGTVARGGLATVSVGYPGVGKETAHLVDRLLRGERDIPTVVAHGSDIYLNTKAAQLMRITIPEQVIKKATKIFTEIK